jgi:hypothetical protein
MTYTYTVDLPCRPLKHGQECGSQAADYYRIVESTKDAAFVFADRYARRIYGKRGYCHHVRSDSYSENGLHHTFEAFIGVPAEGGGTDGKNIWLHITVKEG